MLTRLIKSMLPRRLMWRAVMIMVLPLVTVLLVVSGYFINRHYEGATLQMTSVAAREIGYVHSLRGTNPVGAARAARALGLTVTMPFAPLPPPAPFWDLAARHVAAGLRDAFPEARVLVVGTSQVILDLSFDDQTLRYELARARVSPRNPHQLLVATALGAAIMSLISFVFLKNQVRPILQLAAAAEAFGRGQILPYRPRGSTEVRAAGHAFLTMRARIERQIEQRTLLLSGVSHDLRTPLTRLRLGLEMLDDQPETRDMVRDVAEMETMIERFLDFARAESQVEPEMISLHDLLQSRAARLGDNVTLDLPAAPMTALLRADLLARALDNLLANALRYGTRVRLRLRSGGDHLIIDVEDDGPGIPKAQREAALRPFVRLDQARDPNRGGSVGLGLAIVTEVARAHGGQVELDRSPDLGGLWVRLILPATR